MPTGGYPAPTGGYPAPTATSPINSHPPPRYSDEKPKAPDTHTRDYNPFDTNAHNAAHAHHTAQSHPPHPNRPAADPISASSAICSACTIPLVNVEARFCHACGAPSDKLPHSDAYEWSVYDPGLEMSRTSPIGVANILGKSESSPCVVPRRITACSILGRSNVNLTRSQFVHGTTNVYATAVLGGFTLVVPRGVNVLVNGMSILGKFKNAPNAGKTVDPNRPTVKVHGISILGRARVLVDHKCPEVRVIRRPAPPVY